MLARQSPVLPLAPRVEQSPTPTMHRERVRLNFIAISQFRRRGGAPLRPPLPGLQARKSTPAPLPGLPCRPLQAKGKACVKNIAISKFHRRGEHCSPGFAEPANPKIHPRTVSGPAMQAPTSKRQGLRKKISLFQNFIVGASIARPLKPCAAARPLGWSRALPLP